MRLIDADTFKKQIAGMTIANNYPANKASALCDLMDAQPTAYDVDKVVAELKRKKFIEQENILSDVHQGFNAGLSMAIQIVKGGGVDGD